MEDNEIEKDKIIEELHNLAGSHNYLKMVASQNRLNSIISSELQEAILFLRDSLNESSKSSEKLNKRIIVLNWALVIATIVLAIAAIASVYVSYSLLK